MNPFKQAEITFRINRANETFKEALDLAATGGWHGVANRLYYASFYMVNALMIQEDIKISSHDGSKQMLGLHFILTGKLDSMYGKFYGRLFNTRQSADYGDFISYTEDEIYPLISQTKEFIAVLNALIRTEP